MTCIIKLYSLCTIYQANPVCSGISHKWTEEGSQPHRGPNPEKELPMTVWPSSKLHWLKNRLSFKDRGFRSFFYLFLWKQWLEEKEVAPKAPRGWGPPGVLDRALRGPLHNVERESFRVSILSFTGKLSAEWYNVLECLFPLFFSEPVENHEFLLHIILNHPHPVQLGRI